MSNTKTTPEGTKFVSARFDAIKTPAQWRKVFSSRYSNMPAKIALAFATRDMRAAK
jgi:hypothetical protein